MRVHPVRIEQTPLYLHFTYSLCLHAAAISLLVALPVVGVSGAPPGGGGYVVALTSQVEQTPPGGAPEKMNRRPAGEPGRDRPEEMGRGNRDAGTDVTNDDGKYDVEEDIQLPDVAGTARMQTGINPVADKPDPVPVPSNITAPSAKAPEPTSTVKPFVAEMPSEPLPAGDAGAAGKTDALHQAEAKPPALTKTSAAVKPTPSAAPPVQKPPLEKSDVPEVLPDPEPESVAVMPPAEITPPVPEKKIALSKNAAKTRGDDASPPADAIGTTPEDRGKDPIGQSHPAGKPAGTALARKGGQAGSRDSDAGGLTSGGGRSSKKSETGGPAKSGGRPGAGRGGDVGTGNIAGTPPGSGKGYKFSAASPSREVGLLRGIGDTLGEPTLARREGSSNKDTPEKEKKGAQEAPKVAIQVPEALLVRDIEIEVVADKKALSNISMDLAFRAHPANRKKHARDAEKKIEGAEIAIGEVDSGASATKKLLLRKAEKGVYIFSLTNTGSASSVAVVFHFYARSEQERMKEYKSLTLTPTTVTKFKFLMPEALFWDDTDRFSGSIEDSHSVTRFRHETGLLWKEEKE